MSGTIQLIINSILLRELDERKLINAYARFVYNSEKDTEEDALIRQNLEVLLDWDVKGDDGLGIYCSRFESIKRKDWKFLIDFIKENAYEIRKLSYTPRTEREKEIRKVILSAIERKEKLKAEHFSDENYKVTKRGKPAKPCNYKGRIYKSRQECVYKEGITQNQLYRYLEKTGQV